MKLKRAFLVLIGFFVIASSFLLLEITYAGLAPVASFTYSPVNPYTYETITFNASASYDPDGDIVSYKWDFGDGNVTTVTNPIITHVYTICGNVTVTLTVTDDEGLTDSTSETVTVLNPALLRLWADAGSYVSSHHDAWILESWVVSSDVPPGGSVSFDLYIDAISNPSMIHPTYDVYLAVAVNDTAQVASITISLTTITTFTLGEVTWPDEAGGGTLPPHGVYPTWYALAPFGDVASNHGYYTTPGDPYGPYWAFRAHIPVTITTSATMNAGFKFHFDAQGTLERGSTSPGHRNHNSYSHDLTFEGALYTPPQYLVTFSQTGLSADASGTVVTVNGVPKTFADLPYSLWVDESSIITYSYEAIVSSTISGQQFRLDSVTGPPSPITVTGPTTVTGNYVTQYLVTFTQTGLDAAATGIVVTVDGVPKTFPDLPFSKWVDSGATVTYSYETTVFSTVSGKRFRLNSITGPTSPITVTAPTTVIGNYVTQYLVTVAQTGLDTTATGTVVTVNGVPKTFGDLPFYFWVDSGSLVTYSYGSIVSSSVSGKRFSLVSVTGPTSPITVTSPVIVTGNYKTQYLLVVRTDPNGLSPQPTRSPPVEAGPAGGWWYDSSTNVVLTAQAVSSYTFLNWDVDGTSRGDGVNPITVHMDGPHTATAYYQAAPPPPPVGGVWVPVNKFELLFPWIGLASLIVSGVITVAFLRYKRKKQ